MTAARSLFILPDREQAGELEVIEQGEQKKLKDAIELSRLPPELVLGIPESVLAAHPDEGLVFAQLARQAELGRTLFALSARAGKDKSGRTVYLTNLQILPTGASPTLLPTEPALPEEEQQALSRMAEGFNGADDVFANAARKMLAEAEQKPELRSFASLPVPRSAFPPDWTPDKKKALKTTIGVVAVLFALASLVTELLLR